ncbi:uncharacterized protein SPAPADRAFT_62367 [Spathaspora passalidarum NRRL Y-27907]|uniref:BHLH domain-containing protein n=1 Tax=Spathaspora passalidarum (strain NRRL Y-27907 / 11-Y1) TaxID=619300 RepID=G3ARL9_SPAPN|nr:uncharacterized protein SPAPADRAFT_62367 [Spathaspora passalidarum NRRL Y-27907]EGW31772.1 hypothetical protein SPAPADRAFT_62367 [Spathaspora passalidarum NRRL Y-27907]
MSSSVETTPTTEENSAGISDEQTAKVGEASRDTSISSLSSIENTQSNISIAETGEKVIVKKVSLPQSFESKTNFYDSLSAEAAATAAKAATELEKQKHSYSPGDRKPVKFTVRKVSHEIIKSPLPSPTTNAGHHGVDKLATSNSFSAADADHGAKTKKLRHAQHKYDLYNEKIAKIDKEIEFLEKLLPPYNVEIDYNTRNKITRAIDKLKSKQDELRKRSYELGITISRLWREQEGSDIWVKRSERISS